MAERESRLVRAECRVREGMKRVGRQANLVVRLAVAGRLREAKEAQKLLSALEESLRLAQEHYSPESRGKRGNLKIVTRATKGARPKRSIARRLLNPVKAMIPPGERSRGNRSASAGAAGPRQQQEGISRHLP